MDIREKILAAEDIQSEAVVVPEWDVTINMMTIRGWERARLINRAMDKKTGDVNFENIYPDIIIYSAFDPETDKKIFHERDRDELLKKSGKVLERLARVGLRLAGMGEKELEEIEKNSDSGIPSADSISA